LKGVKKRRLLDMNLNSPEFWDEQFEKEYEAYMNQDGYVRWQADRFEPIARLVKEGRIVDVGCGLGHMIRYLHARNIHQKNEYFGIDYSEYAVNKASELFEEGNFKTMDAFNLRFPDKFFDTVILMDVIEHVEEPEELLEALVDSLKEGGRLILTSPVQGHPYEVSEDHVKEYSILEMRNMLDRYGETKVSVWENYLGLYVLDV
jgi:2-polyprenyl-3-methyl-5-hydroxy-6-metoxy-1,4-benzoquinol methylase